MNLEKPILRSSTGATPRAPPKKPILSDFTTLGLSRAAAIAASMQPLIDDLPEEIAILDEECTILAANEAWKSSVAKYGHSSLLPGCSYRDFCMTKAAQGFEPAAMAILGLEQIVSGERRSWRMAYNGQDQWAGREFQVSMSRIEIGSRCLISVMRHDVTEVVELRRAKRESSMSVMEGQAIERQRMARELHDSTSQLLASIGLTLGILKGEMTTPQSLEIIADLQALLTDTHREIRSISYLAHPPALDDHGLGDALKALLEGFTRRVGLKGWFEILGEPWSLPREIEATIYRVAQEAMTNIRHAHASRVGLSLCFRPSAIHLVVSDDGVGISRETVNGHGDAGVGLASMRERLIEMGGRLTFRHQFPGTAVIASLPANAGRRLLV